MKKQIKILPIHYLLSALALVIVERLIISLKAPLGTYGYDYGFYLFAIKNAASLGVKTFSGVFGGFNNPLFFISHAVGANPEVFLTVSYFIAAVLSAIAIYYYLLKYDTRAAVFAVALYAASLIQIEAYSMFLWKYAVAVPLLLFGLKAYEEKKWWLFGILGTILALTHRTSFLVFMMVVLILFVINLATLKKWVQLISLGATSIIAVVLSSSVWLPIANNLINNGNYFVETGLFLNNQNKWAMILPTLMLAIYGIYSKRNSKIPKSISVMLVLSLVWYMFGLPFYQRMFLYFDLALIGFAALGIANIQLHYKAYTHTVLGVILGLIGVIAFGYSIQKHPYIDQAHINEIKTFKAPDGVVPFILISSADDAPWILGYTEKVRLGAPGLFEDPHTKDEWENFWRGYKQQEFISKYPRPLYLYQKSYVVPGKVNECLKKVSENFYEYTCK